MHLGNADKLLARLQNDPGKPVKAKVLQLGAIAALWNVAKEMKIVETIDRHVQKRDQGLTCGQYILLAAINRCVAPTSKASMYDWYQKTVLQRLLPTSKKSLCSQRFWDHMSYLDADTIYSIEKEFAQRLIGKFNIDVRMLLFDATNFDTYISTQTICEIAQRGHAKSKRKDLRIIGLALLVTLDFHLPMLSYAYPGNQNDPTMFSGIVDEIVDRYKQFSESCEEITLVFDGGNTSHDNMDQIVGSSYHFITSLTLTHHKDLLAVPISKFESFDNPRLNGTTAFRTKKVVWGKELTTVITRSDNLLRGQLAGINAALKKKRKELWELWGKLQRSQKPGAKGKGYTHESLTKRLKEITKGQYISEILKTEITQTRGILDFTFSTDFNEFERIKRVRLGKRILCTDNSKWTTEDIILGSRAQSHVEDAFKDMKDPKWVSFSPSFHWTDQKLRVHIFYCLIGLTLTSLLVRKASQTGHKLSIDKLYEQLTEVTEIVNLYTPDTGGGRPRAEYVLSSCSKLQEKLCQLFNIFEYTRAQYER